MSRTLSILILVFILSVPGFAQRRDGNGPHFEMRQKIEAQKISFITQQVSLNPEEAQRFWPVYNELEQKKNDLREQARKLFFSLRNEIDTMSDKQLNGISDELIEIRLKEVMLEKEYHNKFKKILSPRKILQLYQAEKQFQSMLLHQIKERGRHQFGNKE